jgi:DNA-binding MarR family transcriptional regulator
MDASGQPGPRGAAFLLAQLGEHASERFAERVQELGLTPPEVGLLRMIAGQPGRSQQSVAVDLGVVPSRVVVLIDNLGHKGLVERRPGATDRRHHALHLTVDGQQVMIDMRSVANTHENEILAALDPEERSQLARLLRRVADQQGLTPGVHPGYKRVGVRRPTGDAKDKGDTRPEGVAHPVGPDADATAAAMEPSQRRARRKPGGSAASGGAGARRRAVDQAD